VNEVSTSRYSRVSVNGNFCMIIPVNYVLLANVERRYYLFLPFLLPSNIMQFITDDDGVPLSFDLYKLALPPFLTGIMLDYLDSSGLK
jgi:hypothetical protein